MCVCSVVSDSATPWTVAHQAPLSLEFSRQEYWNGLTFPPPGDIPDTQVEPASLVSPAVTGGFFTIAGDYNLIFLKILKGKIMTHTNIKSTQRFPLSH